MNIFAVFLMITIATDLVWEGEGRRGKRGLTMRELDVPSVVDVREDVTLRCHFDTGSERLYSVKWYKDEFEFFRYMPSKRPPSQIFPVEGVNLKEEMCSKDSVTLTFLTFDSSGTYRCEVSTEAPNFETVYKNANMTVMALPRHDPMIEGVRTSYSIGDTVRANCTSAASNPPAALEWYINGIKAERWILDQMPIVEDESHDLVQQEGQRQTAEEWVAGAMPLHEEEHAHGLVSRTLGLSFAAERRFFQEPHDTMRLRCAASVGGLQRRSEVASALAVPSARTLSASRHTNAVGTTTSRYQAITVWFLALVLSVT